MLDTRLFKRRSPRLRHSNGYFYSSFLLANGKEKWVSLDSTDRDKAEQENDERAKAFMRGEYTPPLPKPGSKAAQGLPIPGQQNKEPKKKQSLLKVLWEQLEDPTKALEEADRRIADCELRIDRAEQERQRWIRLRRKLRWLSQ